MRQKKVRGPANLRRSFPGNSPTLSILVERAVYGMCAGWGRCNSAGEVGYLGAGGKSMRSQGVHQPRPPFGTDFECGPEEGAEVNFPGRATRQKRGCLTRPPGLVEPYGRTSPSRIKPQRSESPERKQDLRREEKKSGCEGT